MNDPTVSRYLKLVGLTLALALLIYLVMLFVFAMIGVDFPHGLRVIISLLGSALIVYNFFSGHIF